VCGKRARFYIILYRAGKMKKKENGEYTEEFKKELDRRLEEYKKDPSIGITMEESERRVDNILKRAKDKKNTSFSKRMKTRTVRIFSPSDR
jgi:hypothetical protein